LSLQAHFSLVCSHQKLWNALYSVHHIHVCKIPLRWRTESSSRSALSQLTGQLTIYAELQIVVVHFVLSLYVQLFDDMKDVLDDNWGICNAQNCPQKRYCRMRAGDASSDFKITWRVLLAHGTILDYELWAKEHGCGAQTISTDPAPFQVSALVFVNHSSDWPP
jgi:hypothetical protein